MAICDCGRLAIVRTSWTDQNPGRRFYACPVQPSQDGPCRRFFGWVNPPMCPRVLDIIPGLLRSKNKLDDEITELRGQVRKQDSVICALVLVIAFVVWVAIG